MRVLTAAALVTFLAAAALAPAARAQNAPAQREVLLVGNNWDGTADVLDVPTYKRLDRINIVPDLEERKAEIMLDPAGFGYFVVIRELIGEGHDQLVDDLFASRDGREIYVSRPSLKDVVAIDLATKKIRWRRQIEGYRADHMAISPDGARLVVSASTANVADVIDTATGTIVGSFPSGDSPHENNFSKDGSLIFHASIGRVYTPTDEPALDTSKGEQVFQIVDAKTLKVLRQMDMGAKLEEFGLPGMSSAVRPMALSPDERWLYFQVSFFHGFVEYDLLEDKVTRVAHLPVPEEVRKLRRDEYILDSAHHGLAMNGEGTKLCVAGTMSNYAAIVSRESFRYRIHPLGARTYWSTTSADGHYCYVSVAGDDSMSIISYDTEEEVARVPVGDHPQRARTARVATSIYGAPAASAANVSLRAKRRASRRVRLSGRLAFPATVPSALACRGTVRLELRRGTKVVARAPARLRQGSAGCGFERTLAVPRRVRRVVARATFPGNSLLRAGRSGRVALT